MVDINLISGRLENNYNLIVGIFMILMSLTVVLVYLNADNVGKNDLSSEFYDLSYKDYSGDKYIKSLNNSKDFWKLQKNINTQPYRIYEVDKYRNESLRDLYLQNAWKIYNKTYNNAKEKGWFNRTKAKEDGFYWPKYTGNHNINDEFWRDNRTLDPERPEFLIYRENNSNNSANMTGSDMLLGVMYMVNTVEKDGEQIGGPLTKWHYHTSANKNCYYNGFPRGKREVENCPERYISNSSPEMMHIWFVDHPEGVFATKMTVPEGAIRKGNDRMNRDEFYEKVKEEDYNQ